MPSVLFEHMLLVSTILRAKLPRKELPVYFVLELRNNVAIRPLDLYRDELPIQLVLARPEERHPVAGSYKVARVHQIQHTILVKILKSKIRIKI
jgi:hypothetical protein